MIDFKKCEKLFNDGFSLLTVNGKVPNFSWKPNQDKPLSLSEFESRYNYSGGEFKSDGTERKKTTGIGIITGYDYLECVDVDLKVFSTAKEQKEFWDEYLSFLEDNILDFHDKFVIAKTMNNGYHILFKSKRVEGNKKVAKLKGHNEAIIETRGIGGYIFVYENFLNDKSYRDIGFISDEDREILFSCSRIYDYVEPKKDIVPAKEKKEYERRDGDIAPWDDFNNKNTVWDIVKSDFTIVSNLRDRYVIKRHNASSPHSGYIFKDNDIMYLFSTGTIYDAEKAYTAWSANVCKNFQNDFSAAASQAYFDGYGSRVVIKENEPHNGIKIKPLDLEFPIDVFSEPIQNYISQCSTTLNSNIDYMGCSLLWLISVSIGNAFNIEVKKGWVEVPNIWVSLVGKAGIGKTPSIKNIIFPFERKNNLEIYNYIKKKEEFDYYDNLPKKEKEEYPEVNKPMKNQFIANDITLEALVDLHQENDNSVGVFKDELAGWFKDMNKYRAGSDLEFWLSTWSGKSVHINRISRVGSFVSKPMIPVIGGIQPGIFNTFYTDENKDNGFLDRMLLSFPDLIVEKYTDSEMDEKTIQWFSDTVIDFYDTIRNKAIQRDRDGNITPNIVRFGSEAKIEWIRIFNEITEIQNSDTENEYMKSMLPKQKSYIPRFALLLHIFNGIGKGDNYNLLEISKESILCAEKLSKYFVSMAKKIKINSLDNFSAREIIKNNKGKSNKEIFKNIYKRNPEINIREVSELLGVSVQSIYKYKKDLGL